jgi:hypothetical protein
LAHHHRPMAGFTPTALGQCQQGRPARSRH